MKTKSPPLLDPIIQENPRFTHSNLQFPSKLDEKMDLEEWEVLPEDGFLQIHDDGGGKKIFSRKYSATPNNHVFKMNYFVCPPAPAHSSNQFVETTNQLVSLPLPSVQFIGDHHHRDAAMAVAVAEAEPDRVSQVSFKKIKETEFPADMKLDSPKSNNNAIMPQVDVGEVYKADQAIDGNKYLSSPRSAVEDDSGGNDDHENGLNIWNWSMTGVGAIFSVGVAAVVSTVCILFVGSRQKHRQNHKLRFQIYTDDKVC